MLSQGYIEQRADAADLNDMTCSGTVALGEIGDVYDIHLPSDHPPLANPGWPTVAQPFCERLRQATRHHGSEFLAIVKLQRAARDGAKCMRFLQDRFEDGGEITRRGIDHAEHLGGGSLLLQGFARFGDQPRVLYRDDRLRREIVQQGDLCVGEWPDFGMVNT